MEFSRFLTKPKGVLSTDAVVHANIPSAVVRGLSVTFERLQFVTEITAAEREREPNRYQKYRLPVIRRCAPSHMEGQQLPHLRARPVN